MKEYDIIDRYCAKMGFKKSPLNYSFQESGKVLLKVFHARRDNLFYFL